MDRSRRQGARETEASAGAPPRSSRLTIRPKAPNRRRPAATSLWQRLPKPAAVADACGRALRRSLPVLAAIGVLGAISGTAWAGYRFVTGSPRFAIEQIAITGNHHLTDAQVRARLPIHRGDNVFATSLDAVVGALRADPWIAHAEAHRVLPHTVTIDLVEHEPALVVDLGGPYLVDATGHPFKRAATGEGDGLPLVTGLDRAAYLADPQATATVITGVLAALTEWHRSARPAASEVHVDPHGALALHTGGTTIQLGAPGADLAARLRTFDAAWADLSDDERARARAIHLDTRTDHVTVAFAQKDQ